MQHKLDIVATWPKIRTLESYLEELERAEDLGLFINFRVANLPKWGPTPTHPIVRQIPFCYMVHDGYVRGYNVIKDAVYHQANTVSRVENDSWAGCWPPGNYIVRYPHWNPITPTPMKGFQGWRWYDATRS